MDKRELIPILIIFLMFLSAIYFYPRFTGPMITHWGPSGEPDGYGSKFLGLLLMPIFALGLYLLLSITPYIEVYKKNLMKFYSYYFWFKAIIIAFFAVIYVYTILQNLGYRFDFGVAMVIPIAALLLYAAVLIRNAKRNYFVGIRTPWTLANERVWNETHKTGAWAFGGCAIIALIGLIFRQYLFWFLIIPLLAYVVFIYVYSYLLFRKYGKQK
jgi:uncharacterized membrane protein